jgi:hypothetical protein
MTIKTILTDGVGRNKRSVGVTKDNALQVSVIDPISIELSVEQLTRRKLFYSFLYDGSNNDMNVDGSTPVTFTIASQTTAIKWVSKLRVLVNGTNFDLSASGDFRKFGSAAIAPGLTNGIELFVVQSGLVTPIFTVPVKNMGDFFDYETGYSNFINAVSAQSDFLSIDLDLPEVVVLPPGALDYIGCRINDDLTSLDKLQILASGYQEVVEDE